MNKIVRLSFALVLIMGVFSLDTFGQRRIRFARGHSSATVSGRLGGGASRCFVLGASAGQSLEATLSSGNGYVEFFTGGTSFSRSTRSGDNSICVKNHGRTSNFSLSVSIQ